MAEWDYILNDQETGYFSCAICDCYMDCETTADEHVKGRRHCRQVHRYGMYIVPQEGGEYYCNLCNCWIYSNANILQHMKGQRHQSALDNDEECLEEEEEVDPYSVIVIEGDDKNYCCLCDSNLTGDSEVYSHVDSTEHKEAVEKYGYDIVASKYKWLECTLCECTISSYREVYEHLMGPEHTEALEAESGLE